MSERLIALKQRMGELADISHAMALAQWDRQTVMPARGSEARADSLATLARISHQTFVDDETGRLLDGATAELNGRDGDDDDVRMVALARRQWEKARRVSPELAADLARASSLGQAAWVQARADSDFAAFAPYLERNFELTRRYVDCHSGSDDYACAYDVLLDDFEPLMPTAQVAEVFADLKAQLVPMIARIAAAEPVDDRILFARFPVEAQRRLVLETVQRMGFESEGWRIDDTVHPFAMGIGAGDVRITTRWDEHYFPTGLFGAMHECGHGLYEAGLPDALRRTPLGDAGSLGLHESQSRLWENMVGRGRSFADVLAPRAATLAGGDFAELDADTFYKVVNRVKPTFIRVEADEATYALHIILRFELEQELVAGTLAVNDLPAAWNARCEEYLGISVTDDADGVLQDVHWSEGLIGYFPTYALGNLIAGQLWERAHTDIPGLEDQLGCGEFSALRAWLGEHVHRHASKYTTTELLQRELGSPITVEPFIRYLKDKLGDVYDLDFDAE